MTRAGVLLAGLTHLAGVAATPGALVGQTRPPLPPAVVLSEFVFTAAPFASAHASTIVETRQGLVAAWFGGAREGAPDVGIWVSRKRRSTWMRPVRVATGLQPDGRRYPCWNPVLVELTPGELTLYYRVGPNPRTWWTMQRTSRDGGVTWSAARRLPVGVLGPIKNKPVRLATGVWLSPSSTESSGTPSRWRVHFERSADDGRTWTVVAPPVADSALDAIQPAVLLHRGGWLQALVRTQAGRVYETWSADQGLEWSALAPTSLPNPNAGLDALALRDGRLLVVYNHTASGRTPLTVAVSMNGITWGRPIALESGPGEYSYPAVIQTADGLVHVTYTWRRTRVRHVVINPRLLRSPRSLALDSLLASLTPKLAPLAAGRDSLAIVIARDSASVRADSALWRFRESAAELLKTIVTTFDDSAFQRVIYPADSTVRRRVGGPTPFVPPDLAAADSLTRFLDAHGVWPFRDEGATYYALSESSMLRVIGPYVTESMRASLRLEALEQTRPSVEDAAFRIPLDEVADRLAAADSVTSRSRGTLAYQQIDWRRAAYLSALVNGLDNSPAFDSAQAFLPAFRQALVRFAARHGATPSGRVVRDYLALLRANGYRDAPAVSELRRRVRDSAGPRG